MFCKKCGSEIPDGSKVCPACGNPLAGKGGKKPPKKKKSLTGWIAALSILLVLSAAALTGSLVLLFQQEGAEDVDATVPASYLNEAGFRNLFGVEETSETAAETSEVPLEISGFSIPNPLLPTETTATTAPSTAAAAGDFIFPDSNSTYLDRAELEALTPEQLRIARNEIYARLGRTFDDPELQNYFNSKSWYVGKYTPAEFDSYGDSILNEFELANSRLILEVEEAKKQS